ncbi:MAG: uracil phosphoribosyltransferase [Candidatus Gastranaerophilales bacterium]|nr:uracil phosphoribosyltransferase [Candidatus Gastranaerophilales bacterium]
MEVLTNKLTVLKHPLINHNLAIIRDKNSSSETFKNALKRITYALIFEATKNIKTKTKEIETPVAKTNCEVFDDDYQVIIAPILRAGMIFCEVAQEMLPFSNVHHIGMYRDEETLEPVWYYDKKKKIKQDKSKVQVIILDPMLATGNSGIDAIKNFISKDILEENIVFMCLISSPEGIKRIQRFFPKVQIVTAAIDKELNSKGYIVPGLGDAGDRIYNTPD